jgi:hypothetical protein
MSQNCELCGTAGHNADDCARLVQELRLLAMHLDDGGTISAEYNNIHLRAAARRIERLEADYAELCKLYDSECEAHREALDDLAYRNQSDRRVLADECPADERHCGCVPTLRREVERLRAIVDKLPKDALGNVLVPGVDVAYYLYDGRAVAGMVVGACVEIVQRFASISDETEHDVVMSMRPDRCYKHKTDAEVAARKDGEG